MTNESNKQLVRKLNKGFEENDVKAILACLADDVQWTLAGEFNVEGKEEFARQIHNGNFTGAPVIKVKNEISEGDYLAVEGDVESDLVDGTLFRAFFHTTYYLQNGKIKRMNSYVVPYPARDLKSTPFFSGLLADLKNQLMKTTIQMITPFLWFDNQAEEAVNFYISVFSNSSLDKIIRYGEAGPGPAGEVMLVNFQLAGQEFAALNGGPLYKFSEAISFVVNCETQEEVDEYWEKLSAGGEKGQCGWLKDKFGLSWQVVPMSLLQMLQSADADATARVMQAMLKMTKLEVVTLEQAFE